MQESPAAGAGRRRRDYKCKASSTDKEAQKRISSDKRYDKAWELSRVGLEPFSPAPLCRRAVAGDREPVEIRRSVNGSSPLAELDR